MEIQYENLFKNFREEEFMAIVSAYICFLFFFFSSHFGNMLVLIFDGIDSFFCLFDIAMCYIHRP